LINVKSSINYIQYFGTKNYRSEEEIQELRDRLEASENHILDLVGLLHKKLNKFTTKNS